MTSILRWVCVFQGPSLLLPWSAVSEVSEGPLLLFHPHCAGSWGSSRHLQALSQVSSPCPAVGPRAWRKEQEGHLLNEDGNIQLRTEPLTPG